MGKRVLCCSNMSACVNRSAKPLCDNDNSPAEPLAFSYM